MILPGRVTEADRPWSVLVPITVFYPEVEAFFDGVETPDLQARVRPAP